MKWYQKALRFVYPDRCPYCSALVEADDIACDRCLKRIVEYHQPIRRGVRGHRCISSFTYDGKVRRMIIRVKFHDRIQHIRQIADILYRDILGYYGEDAFDLITDVPMHPKDLKRRGYNQSQLLAIELGRRFDLPYQPILEKTKRTKKQHRLTYQQRRKNLVGAFRVTDKQQIQGRCILLIDDVVTSGVTLGECCKTIDKYQPQGICCATIANAAYQYPESTII